MAGIESLNNRKGGCSYISVSRYLKWKISDQSQKIVQTFIFLVMWTSQVTWQATPTKKGQLLKINYFFRHR